tara:strand:+ start:140 stop:637 length:498 start_codon:yes stop_codon:yes gene_type:complete
MTKKGIVQNVQANGTWQGKFGLMYKYEVTIGTDVGEYSSKSENQNKFIVGQEVEYEFTDGQYPKIKPVNNFQAGGFTPRGENPDRQRMIVRQSSLKVAMDYCAVKYSGASELRLQDVFNVAEEVIDWVMEKPAEKKPTRATADIEEFANHSGQTAYPKQDDQLPF